MTTLTTETLLVLSTELLSDLLLDVPTLTTQTGLTIVCENNIEELYA